MSIDKFGKSNDPVQQALRDHKKRWNLAYREFRKRVAALSQGLNGKGNPSYGLPPTDIKEPLPNELGSFLNELANNFQQLVEEVVKIEQEQATYSQHKVQQRQQKVEAPAKVATASVKQSSYLAIADKVVPTLIAVTAEEQAQGLMNKDWPPPVMSFVYKTPCVNRFWMKNTPSPLDIIFSLGGKITAIHKGEPFSTSLIGDYTESDLVVEMPYGTCAKMGIQIGDDILIINSRSR